METPDPRQDPAEGDQFRLLTESGIAQKEIEKKGGMYLVSLLQNSSIIIRMCYR